MKKVIIYSALLIAGLICSQLLPQVIGEAYGSLAIPIRALTMAALAFIMIHVGFEFHIDKGNLKQYGWDYVVAFTAATFPWVLVTLYFVFVMLPPDFWSSGAAWKETLLAGRFAAPTSAGVLFSMLAAAGLGATWLYKKARILAIFDDLDTVLLMIPLKMMMVGLAWQLGMIVVLMAGLLAVAYVLMHKVKMPVTWPWVMGYGIAIALVSEFLYAGSKIIDESVPIHIEVLLPAFVLGVIARPAGKTSNQHPSVDEALHHILSKPDEKRVATYLSAVFMVLVGLNMPMIVGGAEQHLPSVDVTMAAGGAPAAERAAEAIGQKTGIGTVTSGQPTMGWGLIAMHVLAVTVISNLGKMFPAFCYRKEAHWRERVAVAVGMWPRGEVGAGVLVVSLSYGIGGPIVTVAMLSLALNLALTGVIILIVRRLLAGAPITRDWARPVTVAG